MTTTQAITGTLKAAGFQAAIRTRRERRDGYMVRKVGRQLAVFGDAYGDACESKVDEMEAVLMAKGFKVRRPAGSRGVLAVV